MKIGRNDLCPCGSGKKYKRCCLLKQQEPVAKDNKEDVDSTDDDFLDFEKEDSGVYESMLEALNNLRRYSLKNKLHIKEYRKIRKLHDDIVSSMIKYYESGKFEQTIDKDYIPDLTYANKKDSGKKSKKIYLLESDFDMETREGAQAFFDMLIYKRAPNMNCITEEYINCHKFRKPEKVELLQCMLDSRLGLFEITEVDSSNGFAYVKNVFTDSEYKLTDINLSGNLNTGNFYIYTRIITYHNICFGSGLNLLFDKTDPDIINFIKLQSKDYDSFPEFTRFIELYNRFTKDSKGIKVVAHSF